LQVDTVLYNAKVYTFRGIVEAGLAIDNGRIVGIAKEPNLPKASVKLNMNACLLLPGLIDSHVHLRDQQLSYKEDFISGTSAAAAGGITTVVDMPNNQPPTMSVQSLRERMQVAESRILVNVAFNSALPMHIQEIRHIVDAGAVGFKLYLQQQLGGVNVDDENALLNVFKKVSETKVPISVHAEDKSTIDKAKENLQQQGRRDLNAFLKAHSPKAEEKAIGRIIELAKKSGAHIHICHVSSAIGHKAILETKKMGYNVTCEVTPHHLLLNIKHLKKCGNLALEIPPLRTPRDSTYLWQALRKGLIDTIGSDHAPHSFEEKQTTSIWEVSPGIVGLETMLPLLLTEVNGERLTIKQLIYLTSEKPSEIFHLKDRGNLNEGSFADISVVDLKKEYKIDATKFYSKAKFSPFDGWKVKGKAVKTFVNGQLTMDDGEIVAKPGASQIIK
jgi:dihydroorotase (multifunctional complex type)